MVNEASMHAYNWHSKISGGKPGVSGSRTSG
jgi:hypothetical protein